MLGEQKYVSLSVAQCPFFIFYGWHLIRNKSHPERQYLIWKLLEASRDILPLDEHAHISYLTFIFCLSNVCYSLCELGAETT